MPSTRNVPSARRPIAARALALALATAGAATAGAATAATAPLGAQSRATAAPAAADVRARVRAYRQTHEHEILRELVELLAIPNLASDSVNIRRNADALVALLTRRGVSARRLESPGSPPAVYGELRTPGATRTVVFYAHYDGQPVDRSAWRSDPWTPVLRTGPLGPTARDLPMPAVGAPIDPEWRIFARSASDDKSPIVAMLAALDALRASRMLPSVNLKFFFEGEEEAGSEHITQMLTAHRDLLAADAWIFCDGPVDPSGRLQVVFGARGVMGLELIVYGATRALHSGHYGNWAPNPAALLANLLAGMRDPDGRILIANFYDDVRPPGEAERALLARLPSNDAAERAALGLAHTEAGDAPRMERILLPALNVRGIQAGATGASAANAVPVEARASIDFRLVPNQTPERVRSLVEAHLRAQGYYLTSAPPDSAARARYARIALVRWEQGYPGVRTAVDLPVSRAVMRVVEETSGRPPLALPSLGGSLPLFGFRDVLGVPLITMPIVNADNSQHGPNENLRLQNLWDGMEVFAGLMARLGAEWGAAVP
ncbi:MAG TPA: M20/M25/M40 family metallo-hydrolase [Gemmatimonadaceae bacterium]|nr:M20/M25/M40 family metallo-hydrolase [Gemmatimonadaceae bacterium]